MNFFRGLLCALALTACVHAVARADPLRPFGRQGDLGVGVFLGSPLGLSGKYWLSDVRAVDGLLAWKPGDPEQAEIAMDHLWHIAFISDPSIDGRLPFYFGLGLRVLAGDSAEAGIRFPLGLSFLTKDFPIEIFAEVAPVFRFAPDVGADVDGGVGVRYYFHTHFLE